MLFGKYIRRYPLDHKILGDLSFQFGKYDNALMHYKKEEYNCLNNDIIASVEDIGDVYIIEELYEVIVKAYLRKKDYENAIIYCKKIIEDDEYAGRNKASGVLKLADIYVKIGKKDKALELLIDLLDYETDCVKEDPDWDYPKEMYMDTCYAIIKLSKGDQSKKYLDMAMDFYEKNQNSNLGTKMAEIIKMQSKIYKKSLKHKKPGEILATIEQICRNCILASSIYIGENEESKAKKSANEGISLYRRFNLNNYKLHFDLRYQLAYVESESTGEYEADEKIYNDYLKAFDVLKQNNFFDEYKKNIILDKLAYYADGFELRDYYKSQCDYYYLAQNNVKNSDKWIISFITEYEDAGQDYMLCDNYDMAIKCYQKALDNLMSCGFFTGEFYEEEESLPSYERYNISYSKYMSLCKSLSEAYERKKDYDEAIKYLNLNIDCVKAHCCEEEFNRYEYNEFLGIYKKIADLLKSKSDFENSIKYRLFLIGAYNSPNKEKEVKSKSEDIENLINLLDEDKINDYILSESFTIDLSNKWIDSVKYELEDLVKIAKDTELIEFCKQKLELIKDTPFDI